MIGATGEKMIELAGEIADGAVLITLFHQPITIFRSNILKEAP